MVFIGMGDGWRIDAHRLFLGFVAFCLVAPLVQTLYPIFGKSIVAPVEERRAANPFPPLHLLTGANGDFATELNKWFDDRVGFRDLFIRAKNQIDYTLFDTSKKVWIGSDGWLFDRYGPQDVTDLDAAQLASLEDGFVTLARLLRDRGVRLLVAGYPDKAAIYPEMAPPQMPLPPAGGNYGRLRQFLAGRSELVFIDVEAMMKREKAISPEPLYYKTDMHVTEAAQLPVVKEIVARIAIAENRPDIRWNEKLRLSHERWNYGGWGRFMSLLSQPVEVVPYYVGGYTIGATEPDGQWNLPTPIYWTVPTRASGGHSTGNFVRCPSCARRAFPAWSCSAIPSAITIGRSAYSVTSASSVARAIRSAASNCFMTRCRPIPNISSSNITSRGCGTTWN